MNGDVQNDGNFLIDSSSVVIADSFTQASGDTTVDGEILTSSGVSVTGGQLDGTGALVADVTQSGGTIQPGDDPGVLQIIGNYTQSAGVLDRAEFTGRTVLFPGVDWSLLDVTGTASLAGRN